MSSASRCPTRLRAPASTAERVAECAAKKAAHSPYSGATDVSSVHASVGRADRRVLARAASTAAAERRADRCARRKRSAGVSARCASRSPSRADSSSVTTDRDGGGPGARGPLAAAPAGWRTRVGHPR